MAKLHLRRNPKFKKLCKRIALCEAYTLGHLECLWHVAYELTDRKTTFIDAEEIECAADWQGDDGVLFDALLTVGFIDKVGDGYEVHDIADHAPDFVKKRLKRRTTADNGGQWRTMADNGRIDNTIQSNTSQSKTRQAKPIQPKTTQKEKSARFDQFWLAYPNKKAKQSAKKAFDKINPDHELFTRILDAIEQHKKSAQWTRNNGQYIPLPASWLNGGRWDDVFEPDSGSIEGFIARTNAQAKRLGLNVA